MAKTCTAKSEADIALAMLRMMVDLADSTVEKVIGQLTLTQFRALRVIADRAPVTMSRVAQELRLSPSSVTRAGDKLAAQDLVQRAQNPLNKRETLLAPTAKGRQIAERVDSDRRAVLSAILDRLDTADRAALVTAFARFTAVAETVAPPGVES